MFAIEKEDTNDNMDAPAFICGELLFGFVFATLIFIVIIFIKLRS